MEIIKDSSVEWSDQFSCSACNSELRIKADCIGLRIDADLNWLGDEEYTAHYYVNCPVCLSGIKYETVSPAKGKTKKVPHIQALRLKNEWMRKNKVQL